MKGGRDWIKEEQPSGKVRKVDDGGWQFCKEERKAKTESGVRKTTRHKEKCASENEATDGESKNKGFKMGEKKILTHRTRVYQGALKIQQNIWHRFAKTSSRIVNRFKNEIAYLTERGWSLSSKISNSVPPSASLKRNKTFIFPLFYPSTFSNTHPIQGQRAWSLFQLSQSERQGTLQCASHSELLP